jgi:dual specificity MAP kinase phosphatase
MGPYQAAFKTKQLIEMGVTHILNVTCREYTKRPKYFKYLDIAIYDTHSEDSKKHYRITNRFIDEARRSSECKVLVHSVQGKSRAATFILAYLIGREKMKLKDGLALLRQYVPEVEPNESFMQQLAEYDLEILSNKF